MPSERDIDRLLTAAGIPTGEQRRPGAPTDAETRLLAYAMLNAGASGDDAAACLAALHRKGPAAMMTAAAEYAA